MPRIPVENRLASASLRRACRAAVGPTAITGIAVAVEDARTERTMASHRRLPSLTPKRHLGLAAARPSQTVNAASAPARANCSPLWPISSSDSFVSTALMSVVEPQ
jgi:hypothetical protein